jgi:hypothetical protein
MIKMENIPQELKNRLMKAKRTHFIIYGSLVGIGLVLTILGVFKGIGVSAIMCIFTLIMVWRLCNPPRIIKVSRK